MNPKTYTATAHAFCRVCDAKEPAKEVSPWQGGAPHYSWAYTLHLPTGWGSFAFEGAPHPTAGFLCGPCRSRPISDIPLGTGGKRWEVTFAADCWMCRTPKVFPAEILRNHGWSGWAATPKHETEPSGERWQELHDFGDILVCPACFQRTIQGFRDTRAAATTESR